MGAKSGIHTRVPQWLRERLLEDEVLDERGLVDLLAWPDFEGAGLAERVWRAGLLTDRALLALFEAQGARDGTHLLEETPPPPSALGALTRELAARTRSVPLQVTRGRVIVGMLDPADTAALEEIAFFTGLSIEPRAVRASALFRALHDAYGVPLVFAEPDLKVRFQGVDPSRSQEGIPIQGGDDVLPPPPGVRLPEVKVRAPRPPRVHVPEPKGSPLLSRIAAAAETGFFEGPPSTSPAIVVDEEAPAEPADPEHTRLGRDSLPPQVLPLLVPPFRSAVLFLVRGDVAVGWDGKTAALSTEDIRGVLLPLTAESAFQRARDWRMVAAGTARRPTTVERILFRFLAQPAPETFVVVPILVGDETVALLYADRDRGALDDDALARARQVGNTLADGLAPLVARGTLFGPQGE